MSIKMNKKNVKRIFEGSAWKNSIEDFLTDYSAEELEEGGHWGQGHGSGAESFYGTYYGFGGPMQLATKLNPAVAKIKKQQDDEAPQNIMDQQQRNRGYPAPGSSSGMPGGDGLGGPNSGLKYPNNIVQIGKTADNLDKIYNKDPYKNYWGPGGEIPLDMDLTSGADEDLNEQMGSGGGASGPQRGGMSDQNYRDLPGNVRPNKLEKPIRHLPQVENDLDHDGEEDVYLQDDEYVNDVLRLNGINQPTDKAMEDLGITKQESKKPTLKTIFFESGDFVSTIIEHGTEPYKQGNWLDTADVSVDPTKAIMGYEDHSKGHASVQPAAISPGGTSYGAVIAPKGFVPEDWEQRSPQTKEDDFNKTQLPSESSLGNFIDEIIEEELREFSKKNKVVDVEKDISAKFKKNKKEVLNIDKKERKTLTIKDK
jgi:hypothetical protein